MLVLIAEKDLGSFVWYIFMVQHQCNKHHRTNEEKNFLEQQKIRGNIPY